MATGSNLKPKGSIIYKLLIVILGAALIFSIVYPQRQWDKEEANTKECRQNMNHILYAELVYLVENNTYTDTLENVVNMFEEDTTGQLLRRFANLDSILADKIYAELQSDTLAKSIIDSLKRFGFQRDLDTTNALILDSLRVHEGFAQFIDSMAMYQLNHMNECPTVNKPYKLSIVDTSVIKELYIECPIDSLDSLAVENDFLLDNLAGLKISNHGSIENGEPSWEEE
jgi:hypothetical protein